MDLEKLSLSPGHAALIRRGGNNVIAVGPGAIDCVRPTDVLIKVGLIEEVVKMLDHNEKTVAILSAETKEKEDAEGERPDKGES